MTSNTNLPQITPLGLFTANGNAWLLSDGEFPFDNCRIIGKVDFTNAKFRWEERKRLHAYTHQPKIRSAFHCQCGFGDCELCHPDR